MIKAPKSPTRRYEGKVTDPTRWQHFQPRAGDIVVSTPPKSGTTWVQGILAMLISADPEVDANVSLNAPWIDMSARELTEVIGRLEGQTHRRQVKSHTPFDGIPIWPDLHYIGIYRHPIDVHFSFRKHLANMTQDVLGDLYPADISEGFRIFLEGDYFDGTSLSTIIAHYKSALAMKGEGNLLRLHFADMKCDLPAGVARIAAHVGIHHPDDLLATLIDAARFENMKVNADRFAVAAGNGFWHKDAEFFHSGTSNKWLGVLNDDDLAAYDARMTELLDAEDRRWLEWGDVQTPKLA